MGDGDKAHRLLHLAHRRVHRDDHAPDSADASLDHPIYENGSYSKLKDIFITQLSRVIKKKKTLRVGGGGKVPRLVHLSMLGSRSFEDLHRE